MWLYVVCFKFREVGGVVEGTRRGQFFLYEVWGGGFFFFHADDGTREEHDESGLGDVEKRKSQNYVIIL